MNIDFTSRQHIAGMLGIYGNLMTCTFAHGVIMAQFAEDEDQINVAGDDGIVPETDSTQLAIQEAINLFGIHEESKEFITTEAGSIHLKRPIRQVNQLLDHGSMLIWPNIANLRYWLYLQKDFRFDYFDDPPVHIRVSCIGREIFRFLRSIHLAAYISEDDKAVCLSFLLGLEEVVSKQFDIKFNRGYMTQVGDMVFWPKIPTQIEGLLNEPWESTCRSCFENVVVLALREDRPWDEDPHSLFAGNIITCNSDKHLEFLCKVGIAEKESLRVRYYGEDGLRRLIKEYTEPYLEVFEYHITDHVDDRFLSY
jgi:hypothetical protein